MYQCLDAAVARVSAHPARDAHGWPNLTSETPAAVTEWCRWLQQVWTPEFAAAIEVASPVLARRVEDMCRGRRFMPRRARRVVVSVMRYLLRSDSRATPFGLFAGVAPTRFGSDLSVRWGDHHRAVARVDAEWLAGIITALEACAPLRHRLLVVMNTTTFVRDGRLVVGCVPQPGTGPAEVSVRTSRPVRITAQVARSPIRFADLVEKLTTEFPHTPIAVIDDMLARLIARGILVTSLRPPMTVTDPLTHVLDRLGSANAAQVPAATPLVQALTMLDEQRRQHDRATTVTKARELRGGFVGIMDSGQTGATGHRFTVD